MTTLEMLVPMDGSKSAETVLPVAAALSRAYGMALRFLQVVEGDDGSAELDRSREIFGAYVRILAERYAIPPDCVTAATVVGDPADTILVEAQGAAFIALATHGRGGFRARVIGSVADRVLRRTHVPALAVPGADSPAPFGPGPVMVTLDGSEDSQRALPQGRDAARRLGREVVLFQSYWPVPPATTEFGYYPNDYAQQVEEAARTSIASVVRPGERSRVANGGAAESIVEAAQELDACLVVMASSGKGLARRLTLGSTTDGVLHHLRRPLIIIPRSANES